MKIMSGGAAIAASKESSRGSCAFPGLCVLSGGRWLCACRAAPAKGGTVGQHVLLAWSDDEGRSWREPFRSFTPPPIEGRPGLFRAAYMTALSAGEVLAALCWVDHSDPSLPFFNEKTQGLLDTRIFLSRSQDAGESWSEPELMDTSPFRAPTPLTGPVLLLPDKALACQFELNKPYYDAAVWRHSSALLFSRDGGRSWPEHAVTSSDPKNRFFYWDQRPAVLRDGRLLDLFWTYDNRAATYLNIHARESRDGGRSWSPMWDTGVPGQPAPPVSLADGRIAMVYVDRSGAPAIKARTSSDGGRTWPSRTECVIHSPAAPSQTRRKKTMQDAWAEMARFSLGLPTTAPLPGGDVLVVYYAGPETDYTDIRWARLRPG